MAHPIASDKTTAAIFGSRCLGSGTSGRSCASAQKATDPRYPLAFEWRSYRRDGLLNRRARRASPRNRFACCLPPGDWRIAVYPRQQSHDKWSHRPCYFGIQPAQYTCRQRQKKPQTARLTTTTPTRERHLGQPPSQSAPRQNKDGR